VLIVTEEQPSWVLFRLPRFGVEIQSIGEGVWVGVVPRAGSRGRTRREGVRGQKLEAFCWISSLLLYILEGIVELQQLYCIMCNNYSL